MKSLHYFVINQFYIRNVYVFSCIFFYLLIGCNRVHNSHKVIEDKIYNTERSEAGDTNKVLITPRINYHEVYIKRDKNEDNFLFLDFWANMNQDEFKVIQDSLLKKKKLHKSDQGIDYIIVIKKHLILFDEDPNCKIHFKITPSFEDNKLFSISLDFNGLVDANELSTLDNFGAFVKDIVDMYNNKYGKPIIQVDKWNKNDRSYLWSYKNRTIFISATFNNHKTDLMHTIDLSDFDKDHLYLNKFSFIYYNSEYYRSHKQKEIEEENIINSKAMKERDAVLNDI